MPYDDAETEFHLTREGWVKGTHRYCGRISGEAVERPPATVETWQYRTYQRTIHQQEVCRTTMIWHDESVSEAARDALRASFKRPF